MILFAWNDSGGEDAAADAAVVGPPRVGIAAASSAVVGDVGRAGGGGAFTLPLRLRQSSKRREDDFQE